MKTKIIITLLMIAFVGSVSAQNKGMDNFTVTVDGLGCPFCAYGLEKKFKDLDGIKNIGIDMETGVLTFNYPVSPKLTVAKVESQVKDAGYTMRKIEINRADGSTETGPSSGASAVKADMKTTTSSVKVWGNCGMCKARINQTASAIKGVKSADWDVESKQLKVEYVSSLVSLSQIELAIQNVGHDTENGEAAKTFYSKLPMCCKYDRK